MKNELTANIIKKNWKNLSDSVNGDFLFTEYEKAHVNAGIISAEINFKYKGLNILIQQGILQEGEGRFRFKPINISSDLDNLLNFKLSLWRIDIFDKLFNWNRIRTGHRNFDKLIALKGETSKDIVEFFRETEIRNLFIENESLVFNILKSKNKNQIKLRRINSSAELAELYFLKDSFLKLVDRLIDINLLTPSL